MSGRHRRHRTRDVTWYGSAIVLALAQDDTKTAAALLHRCAEQHGLNAFYGQVWMLASVAVKVKGPDQPWAATEPNMRIEVLREGQAVDPDEMTAEPAGRGVLAGARFLAAAARDDMPIALALFDAIGQDPDPDATTHFIGVIVDAARLALTTYVDERGKQAS